MVYCSFCYTYYKKLSYGQKNVQVCKQCSNELYGTSPSNNSTIQQYEKRIQEISENNRIHQKFNRTATLQDIAANKIISNVEQLEIAAQLIPEGNIHWNTLLRAWYRKNKKKGRNLAMEKYPKKRLFDLIQLQDISTK